MHSVTCVENKYVVLNLFYNLKNEQIDRHSYKCEYKQDWIIKQNVTFV